MESYNTLLRYFFPAIFFLQYYGCDSYNKLVKNATPRPSIEVVTSDCSDSKKYSYNGFYVPSEKGRLFKRKGEFTLDSLRVLKEPLLGMSEVKSVNKTFDVTGNPSVQVTLTEKGRLLFKEHTVNNIGKKVAIIVKDELVTAPIISSEIPGGTIEISGVFTQEEVDNMYSYLYKMIDCLKLKE